MRGEVYELKAGHARGHEQQGKRYCVVVQSDDLPLSTWVVAPTSAAHRPASFRPYVQIVGKRCLVMVDHLASVDPEIRLGKSVGSLTLAEMRDIDQALKRVLGL